MSEHSPEDIQQAARIYAAMLQEKLDARRDPAWLQANQPTDESLLQAAWWREARDKYVGLEPTDNGAIYCQIWSRAMYEYAETFIAAHPEAGLTAHLMYTKLDDHWWVEMSKASADGRESTYLFDGTAAQKFPQNVPTDGLYGEKTSILSGPAAVPGAMDIYQLGEAVAASDTPHA